jgi:predicted dehydrogenase
MGDAHSRALGAVRQLGPALEPELVSLSGRDAEALEEARARLGWAEATTDWSQQVGDERVGLFVNGGPNSLHAEPTVAAARAGSTSSARSRSAARPRRRTRCGVPPRTPASST